MDQIKSLYEDEIQAYKQQVNALRMQNVSLQDRVRNLEDLAEKAKLANNDLNTAFEHVREENLRLQQTSAIERPCLMITDSAALEQNAFDGNSITWVAERDRMNQRIKYLERECGRYHRDNITLGKQVRHLLRSLEEERGMIIRHQSQVSDPSPVTAADVIDKHLVTFESIEQLQQQNQKLLSLVKNLSAEHEERDIAIESEEVKKLGAQIEELSNQLEAIKSDRERVLKALNEIHKERDLFKILLCKTRQVEHMTPEIFQRMVSVACASGPAIEDKAGQILEKEAHIQDLRGTISKLDGYVNQLKGELEKIRSDYQEEMKLKDEILHGCQIKIVEERQRADTLQERNSVLEANIESALNELDTLREKYQRAKYDLEKFEEDKKPFYIG